MDIDPLITYRINPFSAIYFGSAVDYTDFTGDDGFIRTDRIWFFKCQYLFKI